MGRLDRGRGAFDDRTHGVPSGRDPSDPGGGYTNRLAQKRYSLLSRPRHSFFVMRGRGIAMNKERVHQKKSGKQQRGVTTVEYAIMLVLISIAVAVASP